MGLDRLLGDEQALGDLPVRLPGGGYLGHAELARVDPRRVSKASQEIPPLT
jgi:hypothetical protein